MSEIKYQEIDLYHYTSLNTLMAITENKTIRLTDHRFLNDTSELSYAVEELKNILENHKEDPYYENFLYALNNILNGKKQCMTSSVFKSGEILITPQIQEVQFFTLSLSMQSDSLNMWKMYAEKGCCLKFNSQKLHEYIYSFRDIHFKDGLTNIIDGEVLYGKQLEMDEAVISMFLKNYNPSMIYDELLQWCLKRKSEDFSNEREYRLGFPFNMEMQSEFSDKSSETEKFVFSLINDVIKPQIELKGFPINEILEEVIVSPYNSDLSVLGIKEFLVKHDLSNVNVRKSSISIR